jgi:hypothetical protein
VDPVSTPAYDYLKQVVQELGNSGDQADQLLDAVITEALHAPEHRARVEELIRREIRANTTWFREWIARESRIQGPRIR